MARGLYVKTDGSSAWSQVKQLFIKTGTAWETVKDAWVKVKTTDPGSWVKFFTAGTRPSSDVEILQEWYGYNTDAIRFQGKNYPWSPVPSTLKYYFKWISPSNVTTYLNASGSSGDTATNPTTSNLWPSSTTYISISPSGTSFEYPGVNSYVFEVRATSPNGVSTSTPYELTTPAAPTLSYSVLSSTSIRVTINATTTNYNATGRYFIYTYDTTSGYVYSGGGRGGFAPSGLSTTKDLTGLTAGREYTVYILPVTGTVGTRPFPYNASTETTGYSGYRGAEASINVTASADYTFTFGNNLYVGTNGYIGLDTAGSTDAIPTTGKFLSIFPADLQQDTTTSIWYWSDTSQYIIRWEGSNYQVPSATKIYQATFYSGQSYADILAITVNGTAAGTTAYYKNGSVISSYPSALSTSSSYRVYFDSTTPSYVAITEKSKSVMKQVTGLTSGSLDQGYTTLTTQTNQNGFVAGTIKITGGSTETASGSVSAGTTLTVVANNDWPSGTTFTYQWYRTRDIEGIQPISAGTASTATSSVIGEELYCAVSYSNSGTTGTIYSNSYLIVPTAPSYTLTGNSNGTFTISSVSTTGGGYYYGSYTKDGGASTSISRTSTSTNTTITSGAGSIAVRLYGSANIYYSGSITPTQIDSWQYTDQTTTVTSDVRSSGAMRRVSLPANFTNSSQTVWVGTNGYVSVTVDPTTSPGTTWPTAGGAVVGPGVADLVQSSLDYKADSSNFYVYWKGYRLGDTSKELWYLMKFYWNSTTVDVYFEKYTLTDGSLDAVRNGNSQYSTWANSTSITGMSIPTGMTSSTTNNGVDDNRTAITATKPGLNLTTNPAYGTATRTSSGFTASISTSPNPTGGTYSIASYTASTAPTINSSTGAVTQTGLSAGSTATVYVNYALSGYNTVQISVSGQALSNLTTNPAYGSGTSASGGWSASISTAPSPTGGTYSKVTESAGTATVNSSTGAVSVTGLTSGQSSTVTVRYSLSGYNSVDITASGTATSAASPPATPSAPTVQYKSARNGHNYTWDVTFTFASGVTSMDVMNQYFSSSSGTYTSSPNDTDPANYNIANTYDGYIEFRNFASGTSMPLTDTNGYWDNTYNWMRARIRARNASGSSSWSAWSGWA
jgi:hypothetical protein